MSSSSSLYFSFFTLYEIDVASNVETQIKQGVAHEHEKNVDLAHKASALAKSTVGWNRSFATSFNIGGKSSEVTNVDDIAPNLDQA